jgi:hypothetical protein
MLHWNVAVVQMICFISFKAGFNHQAHDLMMHMLMSYYAYAQMQAKTPRVLQLSASANRSPPLG